MALNRIKRLAAFLLFFASHQALAQEARKTLLFNDGWKFYNSDVSGAAQPEFNDSGWRSVQLPHDWSIESPFDPKWASATGFLPGGIGWYRKTFTLPAGQADKRMYIYFDGVYKNSEVWINGHFLGKRPSGFTSFQYELTPFLNKTSSNTLAVRADHSDFADSRWYTGSGIYRNVYLISTSLVHIGLWGLQFHSRQVSRSEASAIARVTVENSSASVKSVRVTLQLLDPAGKQVATGMRDVQVAASGQETVGLPLSVATPALWSVDHPKLYTVRATLSSGGKITDALSDKVGIRSYVFDKDKGFSLNGQSMKLKGVCIHDDAGALGTAVPAEVWERRLQILKEAGCNAIRLSHNPHADFLYKLTDRMGFLVMDEAFDEWEFAKNKWIEGWNVGTPGKDGYYKYFKEWGERDLADMVKRNYNHPSIILWSIGNEVDYPNDPYSHEILNTGNNPQIFGKGYQPNNPPASRITALAKQLVAVVKREDTSRPVTTAFAGVVMSNEVGAPGALDIAGYNYTEQRYAEDHKKYPDRVIYGSENGMGSDAWKAVTANDYISGQFLWTGVDYMGEAGRWPARANGAGLINMAGFPKAEYYFRQSLWSEKPMIHLAAAPLSRQNRNNVNRKTILSSWNFASGDSIRVCAFTNLPEAELFLNGKPLGRRSLATSAENTLMWNVAYEPGELTVKGYANNGTPIAYTLSTAGVASTMRLTPDRLTFVKGNKHLAQVEIDIVDDKGNLVVSAENEITITVHGRAKLLGLESGSLVSHEDYQSNKRKALNGKLLAYIQTQGSTGQIRVTCTAEGLTSKSMVLSVNN